MTYIEKLLSGIKFDRAVLSEEEEKNIRDRIEAHPHTLCCPGDVFEGAPRQRETPVQGTQYLQRLLEAQGGEMTYLEKSCRLSGSTRSDLLRTR